MIGPMQLFRLSQDNDFCELLASALEIECDGGDSAASFVSAALESEIPDDLLATFIKRVRDGEEARRESLTGDVLCNGAQQ